MDLTNEVTAFVISSGEPSTATCHKHLDQQDCTFTRQSISGVAPMWKAFQQMLDRCKTPYYVQVDADMLLEPWAIRELYETMKAREEAFSGVCQVVAWLWDDDVHRPIQGVKIYRHEIMQRYPYAESLSCEMGQNLKLKEDGFEIMGMQLGDQDLGGGQWRRTHRTFGTHYASQTPGMAFTRWQRLMQKHRALPWMGWLAQYPKKLEAEWIAHPDNEIARAKYLGCIAGMTGPIPTDELDSRLPNQDYRRLSAYVGEHSKGPSELTLYLTDRCNFKCGWCKRQKGGVPQSGNVTPTMLASALAKFPTIRSCCIAGFGEPLMHPGFGAIVETLVQRQIHVGVITNGSLVKAHLETLKKVSYVSVSLNSFDAKEHESVTSTKTWDTVLQNIVLLANAGVRVGVSYVLHKGNLNALPSMIGMAHILGARFAHIHNLLPHGGMEDPFFQKNVLRVGDKDVERAIEVARRLPEARLVESWPELVEFDEAPFRCMSPFVSIGMDGNGFLTFCRRVDPPSSEVGGIFWNNIWLTHTRSELLAHCTGDRQTHDACNGCFGSWRF